LSFEFRLKRRVQFYETDAAGIVHFSTYFRYMEEAEHAMWRDAGLSIAVRNSSIGWPRVNAAFEYFKPLRFEDEFEAHIRIVEIAERRIRYSCSLTCGGDRIATGLMTIVCVEKKPDQPMKSTPIPAEILARLQVAPEGGPNS
jgi:YbgC/YbaW family acyl-CoA thioester hydrolase